LTVARGALWVSLALVGGCYELDQQIDGFTRVITPDPPPEPARASLPRPHLELNGNRLTYEGKPLRFGRPMREWIALLGEPVAGNTVGCGSLSARWPALGLEASGEVPAAFFFPDERKLCRVREPIECPEGEGFVAWRRSLLERVSVAALEIRFGTLPEREWDSQKPAGSEWETPPEVAFPGTFFLNGVGLSGGPQSLDQLLWRLERTPRELWLDRPVNRAKASAVFRKPDPYYLNLETSYAFNGPLAPVDVLRRDNELTPFPARPTAGSWFETITLRANDFTAGGSFSRELAESRARHKEKARAAP
jgi:hypothetical protein